eukprot:1359939-Prymnesium_polylepis.1
MALSSAAPLTRMTLSAWKLTVPRFARGKGELARNAAGLAPPSGEPMTSGEPARLAVLASTARRGPAGRCT